MKDQLKKTEKPKTDEELAKIFIKEYEALCEKHGYQIQVTPAYRISQDTGTWHTVLQTAVGKLNNNKK